MAEIELRPVTPEDVETFFEHQSDPVATAMAAYTPRDLSAHRAHWTKIMGDPTLAAWTVTSDGTVVGNVVSWPAEGTRLVGYWIGREFWGRGIATQALARFLEIEPERPLIAHVAVSNVGSIRVLEKCGFVVTERPPPGDDGVAGLVMVLSGR